MKVQFYRASYHSEDFKKGQKIFIERENRIGYHVFYRDRITGAYKRNFVHKEGIHLMNIEVMDVSLQFYQRVMNINQPTPREKVLERKTEVIKMKKKSFWGRILCFFHFK